MSYGRATKTGAAVFTSAFAATLVVHSANAGLKYWTTGRYDADSYVQDGLVLNYDGIRNVGLNQPHSTTTTTWVNLANPGTHDLSFYAKTSGATANWLDNGYLFNNGTVFREMSSNLIVPGKQTTQVLMDAKSANLSSLGYVWFPGQVGSDNTYWQTWSVSVRDKNTKQIWYNTHAYTTDRPKWNGTEFSYLTALANETYTAAFSGVTEPTSTPGRYPTKTDVVVPSRTIGNWAIGGQPNGSDPLNGSIKSFRFYSNKVLSEEELVWNRAVDQTRFFGAKPLSVIPTTNAVVASSIAIVAANEAAGAYAVDASGHTFTAPASQTVNGRAYTCTGYTLETWDDATGTWGNAQTESGTSVFVTASDRVRITWQWMPGDGIVTRYTTADYVQDGLILHYDGIRNVGVDQPHSYDTTQWKNLAPNGGWDLTFATYNAATKPGEWRKDGYRFEGQSNFKGGPIALPTNQTIQVALYGNGLEQDAYDGGGKYINEAYIYYANGAAFNKAGSLSVRRDSNNAGNNEWIDWTVHGYGETDTRPDATATLGKPILYFTAVLADTFGAVFYGTSVPAVATSRWTANASRRDFTKGPPTVQNATSFGIGGINNADSRARFTGLLNNFRFYSRVLTAEELAHNRVVDDYRFHGIMPVTNVVVASSHSFLSGNEANGNYEISGAYTFTAPTETQTSSHSVEYVLYGYTIEKWNDETFGWSAPVDYEGSSYTWTAGSSSAKVRLTWQWKAKKGLRTAADYGLEDVVPNGLVLHYDGIKNIGAESADVTNPTSSWSRVWVNLADPGQYNLVRNNKSTAAGGWTSDGYAFSNASSKVGGWFRYNGEFTFGPSYSIQTLLDAKVADQVDSTCGYIMFNGGTWQKAALGLRTSSDYNYALYWVCDTAFGGDTRPKIHHASKEYTYSTAIVEDTKAAFFDGVDVPTSGAGLETKSTAATAQTVPQLCLGGGQGYTQDFTGTIKSFRYYDRVLTADELVRNREVDSARYFGVLATTNVVVGGEAYKVEGSWTFDAPETVEVGGEDKPVAGYRLYVIENGEEVRRPWKSGTTFTYPDDLPADLKAARATVRLEWEAEPPGLMILIR